MKEHLKDLAGNSLFFWTGFVFFGIVGFIKNEPFLVWGSIGGLITIYIHILYHIKLYLQENEK